MRYKRYIAVTALCLILTNCAYFNTFYNAKTSYSSAMKAKLNSSNRQAPKELLDRVIEKCGKIIKYHPESRWVDDAIILMGKAYLEKGEFDKALRKFEEIIIYYSESPFLSEALYLTGLTYFQMGDYNPAIGSFNQILMMEDKKLKDAAYLGIIETHFKKKEFDTLLKKGKDFAKEYNKSLYLPRVLLLMGNVYMENDSLKKAKEVLTKARAIAKKSEDKNDIDEKYAVVLIKTKNTKEGLSILKSISEKSNAQEKIAGVTFEMVNVYLENNDIDNAFNELENFIAIYPSGPYAAEAFYKKGLIYEERIGDIESAIASYDNVSKLNPEEEIRNLAFKKNNVLKEIKTYTEILTNPDTSTDIPKTIFLLAEVYLFEKSAPDSALKKYCNVLDSFPESPFAPKSALAIAYLYENKKQDFQSALTTYRSIVEKFPETKYASAASRAIERLGVKQGVGDKVTNEDEPNKEPSVER